jgi:YD repeat-containing protein
MGNLRVHSVFPPVPAADRLGFFEVLYPQTGELYTFNRYGQHVATRDVVTGVTTYNFTYNVNSYYGRLMKVTDSSGMTLSINRDYKMAAYELLPPGGQKCRLTMDSMGQLASFVSADNTTMRFTYVGNSGLIESKENSFGHTFIYEYDTNGRLSHVVRPTGERTAIGTEETPDANTMRVSYPHDSFLAIEYPFKMAVTLETVPHPLLSTERPLVVRRRIILPDNRTHAVEWRYYGRGNDATRNHLSLLSASAAMQSGMIPRSLSPNEAMIAGGDDVSSRWGYRGRDLLVNGENVLTFDYDSVEHMQMILDRHRNEILSLRYDSGGRVIQVVPRGPVEGLNVTYDRHGRWTQWNRGDFTMSRMFDVKTGRMVERKLSSQSVYRYSYKNGSKQPTDVILPSAKQYQLQYDEAGGLRTVTTPSLARHHFHSLMLIGRRRYVYRPPGAATSGSVYMRDYDSIGRLIDERYPSDNRRVTYRYDDNDRLVAVYHDWFDITLAYNGKTSLISFANVSCQTNSDPFSSTLRYEWNSALLVTQEIIVSGIPNNVSAMFRYSYDTYFRVSFMESLIDGKTLPTEEYTFDETTGRLNKTFPFVFERPHAHREVARDVNVEIVREFDTRGRPTDVWYRFNNHVVFTLETKYNPRGQVHQWRRKVRSSDLKAYEYAYDVDGQLVEVLENGQSTWRYEFDPDGNLVKIGHYSESKPVVVDSRGIVESCGDVTYLFDADGFLAQRGAKETFEFDSLGRLLRVHHADGRYSVRFYYDGRGRLAARRDVVDSGDNLIQFFYGDPDHPDHITHVYNSSGGIGGVSGMVVRYFYDDRGQLFAMQRNGEELFYIGLDPFGSPNVVLNGVGSVVKQLAYDPLGACISDSAVDFPLFVFGFRGSVVDRLSGLIFLNGRPYDPQTGRWVTPGYDRFIEQSAAHLQEDPEPVNLYRNIDLWRLTMPEGDSPVTDVSKWLSWLGYNYLSLVPNVDFDGAIRRLSLSNRRLVDRSPSSSMPVMSAFRCAFGRNAERFTRLSLVTASVVTASCTTDCEDSGDVTFASTPYVFGSGIVLTIDESTGLVTVVALESSHESLVMLVTTLLNGSTAILPPRLVSVRGRDVLHFVRATVDEASEDVRRLQLRSDASVVRGLNVSIHRIYDSADGVGEGPSSSASTTSVVRYVDIRVHSEHATISVRYGSTSHAERSRLLHHAWQRAVDAAWTVERERVQSGKLTVNRWTRAQTEQLIAVGRVDGYTGVYLRDVATHPELADWPTNIRFVPTMR